MSNYMDRARRATERGSCAPARVPGAVPPARPGGARRDLPPPEGGPEGATGRLPEWKSVSVPPCFWKRDCASVPVARPGPGALAPVALPVRPASSTRSGGTMRRGTFQAVLLLLALIPGALPGGARAAEAKRYKFVVITHATAVPFFVPVRKGAEDAGKLVGADVTYTGPAGFDIQRQVEFMKSAIAQKVDGIACTLPDPAAFNDVVAEARSKGIPVIAINADAPKSQRMAYIGQGNYEAGRSMGEQIVKLLPQGGNVILAIHTAGAENLEARIRGAKEVLDAKGGFKYRVVATGTDLVKAESLLGAALQADPSVKGMFGVEDVTGIAIGHII